MALKVKLLFRPTTHFGRVDNFHFFDPLTGITLQFNVESADLTAYIGTFDTDGITPMLINFAKAVRAGLMEVTEGSLDGTGMGDKIAPEKAMLDELIMLRGGEAFTITVNGAGNALTVTPKTLTEFVEFTNKDFVPFPNVDKRSF